MAAISAAPISWRPAFVGGPTLGSGLNASLLRKVQIVQFMLGLIFPGVVLQLVQGSPSGSKLSGGTHGGPGDFGDFILVETFGGRSPALKVWILVSTMFRLLFCLSYVRGADVNQDGVKDDTFPQMHIHVGDREGGGKVQAAINQIALFVRHLNGLVGNHPDLEQSVGNPIPLAQYTDALFRERFLALTSAAVSIAAHTEPVPPTDPEEDDMIDLHKLVTSAYQHHFGREPLTDELNRHVLGAVQAGTTPASLYASLATSPEATDPKVRHDRIAGYYLTYLGRPGAETTAEILGWVNGGLALGDIRDQIAGSPEAQAHAAQKGA